MDATESLFDLTETFQPRWNWNPDRVVLIDLETQSTADISRGSRAYLDHPSTRLLCLVAKINELWLAWAPRSRIPRDYRPTGGPVQFYDSEEVPDVLREACERGDTFVAHNAAGFDAYALWRFTGLAPEWYDTLPCARAAGLPGKLDDLGEQLMGAGKDETGQRVMKLLTKAKHSHLTGESEYPIGTSAAWDLLLRYNVRDVELLERVYRETCDYGEADVLRCDFAINSRGVSVDVQLADQLSAAWTHAQYEASQEIERLTAGYVPASQVRSADTCKEWLAHVGLSLDSLDKQQVKRLIDNPEEMIGDDVESEVLATVVEVLTLRQVATSAASGKLASLRDNSRDGRAVEMLVYYGAATGRWSGRGFQPQNMGRGESRVDVEKCLDAIDAIPTDARDAVGDLGATTGDRVVDALRGVHPDIPMRDVLSTLTRPVFQAPAWKSLLIADYAAIEARGVAWLAEDAKLLDAFRSGRDPYCEMASSIFGRTIMESDTDARQVGKVVTLGCGFGMSGNKFGVLCRSVGIDLAKLGTTAAACVATYRDRHAAIKRLWYRFGDAALEVVGGKSRGQRVGRVALRMEGPHLVMVLPSGRKIVYRNACVEQQVPVYCKMLGLPEVAKPTVVYTHPRGYRKGVYGGLLTENAVQALCRDLLAVSLVRCEDESLPVVLHIHDEIVAEVLADEAEQRLGDLCGIMVDPPEWADGFPIGVGGFVSPRYVKSPFRGYAKVKRESI